MEDVKVSGDPGDDDAAARDEDEEVLEFEVWWNMTILMVLNLVLQRFLSVEMSLCR